MNPSSDRQDILAEKTGIHVKTWRRMFAPKGNATAANLFNIIACLQEHEGVGLQVAALASSPPTHRKLRDGWGTRRLRVVA